MKLKEISESKLYKIQEAAEILGISREWLNKLRNQGKVKDIGKRIAGWQLLEYLGNKNFYKKVTREDVDYD